MEKGSDQVKDEGFTYGFSKEGSEYVTDRAARGPLHVAGFPDDPQWIILCEKRMEPVGGHGRARIFW